jgi:sigma-B regulation protein RsbU (phosphoserine phosphatase)
MAGEDQYLMIRRPGAEPERVPLDLSTPCTMGRSASNTVPLADASVSRHHAQIYTRDGSYWIEDLGSKNGTKVGSRKIDAPTRIKPGDQLHLGSVHISFSAPGAPATARVADVEAPANLRSVSIDEISSSGAIDTRSFAGTLSPDRMGNLLGAMDRIGQELLVFRPLDELFQFVVGLATDVLRADRAAILMREANGDDLVTKAVAQTGRGAGSDIVVSKSIARTAIGKRQAILTDDAQSDTRFREQQSVIQQRIHSAMCAPLWHDSDVLGLIYVDNVAAPVPFDEADLRVLTLIAHLTAVKIREEEARITQQRQQEEIQRAAAIQQALLPTEPHTVGCIEIAGRNIPSLDVGGDYFDFVDSPDGRLMVALGDVAGKGMPAALLMTHLHATVRAQVETERPILDVMQRLNRSVHHNLRGQPRFITLVLALVDGTTGEVIYVNGGHNPPFLYRASGEIEQLTEGGLLLGIMPETGYSAGTVRLERGDMLLIYSDGVTEAMSASGEQFGDDRLAEFLRESKDQSPVDVVDSLIERVREFSSRGKPTDDVTVVVMRRI